MSNSYYFFHKGIVAHELIKVKRVKTKISDGNYSSLYETEEGKQLVIQDYDLYSSKFDYKYKNEIKPKLIEFIYEYIPKKFQKFFLRKL